MVMMIGIVLIESNSLLVVGNYPQVGEVVVKRFVMLL